MQKFAILFALFCFFAAHAALAADSPEPDDATQVAAPENEERGKSPGADASGEETSGEEPAAAAAEPDKDAPASAAKDDFWYFAAKIGLSSTELFAPKASYPSDYLLNYNYGLALGYNFFPETAIPLRLEFDFTLRGGGLQQRLDAIFNESIRIKSLSTNMAQAWLDWPISGVIKPYAGGGAGVAFLKYRKLDSDGATSNKSFDFAWTWMLGGGVALKWNDSLIFDFGYRYVKTTPLEIDFARDYYTFKTRVHDFHIGLRSSF